MRIEISFNFSIKEGPWNHDNRPLLFLTIFNESTVDVGIKLIFAWIWLLIFPQTSKINAEISLNAKIVNA